MGERKRKSKKKKRKRRGRGFKMMKHKKARVVTPIGRARKGGADNKLM